MISAEIWKIQEHERMKGRHRRNCERNRESGCGKVIEWWDLEEQKSGEGDRRSKTGSDEGEQREEVKVGEWMRKAEKAREKIKERRERTIGGILT